MIIILGQLILGTCLAESVKCPYFRLQYNYRSGGVMTIFFKTVSSLMFISPVLNVMDIRKKQLDSIYKNNSQEARTNDSR